MAFAYSDSRFQIKLPDGWHCPGFFRKFLFAGQPEFYGPNETTIKFAIGPIVPEPTLRQQQANLEYIALKRGEQVIELSSINVVGKKHATMTVIIPYIGRVKHYSLIFNGTEFLISARGSESITDNIVASFVLNSAKS